MKIQLKNEKKWLIRPCDEAAACRISEETGLPEFLARLLAARGMDTPEKASDFLDGDGTVFHDPFLLEDMDRAVERIHRAIREKERILIYGDYDVDGVSSVSALYLYLSGKGADVCYYIPERLEEGYGLNADALCRFAAANIRLIITVDTGITAVSEAALAKKQGMDLIITDHHECRNALPTAAYAVINPKRKNSRYPFQELAGVGVVFKLICALEEGKQIPELCDRFLDLVSLGTVADVMPLRGENRRIVAGGLKNLNSGGANGGVRALLEEAQGTARNGVRRISASTIGFVLAPRLNAAGRIGNVKHAVELLITKNSRRAEEIASELCLLNRERQTVENSILEEAIRQIEQGYDFERDKVIVLASDHWHQGVIGIVASRITERYGLPSILITFKDETGKGSARSICGFNINEALCACRDMLLQCGGHELAAGLSLEKKQLSAFKQAINDYARTRITEAMRVSELPVDLILSEQELDVSHAELLTALEPFGNGNPTPVFALCDAVVESVTPIGANKHLKLILSKNGVSVSALYFNRTPEEFTFSPGDCVDAAFHLEINEFRGERSVQLNLRDLRPSGDTLAYMNRQGKEYLRAIATFTVSAENLPQMPDFRAAFIDLRHAAPEGHVQMDIYAAAQRLSQGHSQTVTPCMLNIMLDVFAEMGLIQLEREGLNHAQVTLCRVENKVNLEESKLLIKLRQHVVGG